MNTLLLLSWRAAVAGRWLARAAGALMALMFLVFVFAEGPPPLGRLGWLDSVRFLALTAVFGGLVAAWKWPITGGIASISGAVAFLSLTHLRMPAVMLVPAGIGLLNVLCALRLRASAPPNAAASLPRSVLLPGAVLLGILALLVVNEMVVNPPLMTSRAPLPAACVGVWTGDRASITIAPDGGVTGTLNGKALAGGRFTRNRSWFGALLDWRSDYIIRDGLSTHPLTLQGAELTGWRLRLHRQL